MFMSGWRYSLGPSVKGMYSRMASLGLIRPPWMRGKRFAGRGQIGQDGGQGVVCFFAGQGDRVQGLRGQGNGGQWTGLGLKQADMVGQAQEKFGADLEGRHAEGEGRGLHPGQDDLGQVGQADQICPGLQAKAGGLEAQVPEGQVTAGRGLGRENGPRHSHSRQRPWPRPCRSAGRSDKTLRISTQVPPALRAEGGQKFQAGRVGAEAALLDRHCPAPDVRRSGRPQEYYLERPARRSGIGCPRRRP